MTSTKYKIDSVLEKSGAFGRYQWFQIFLGALGPFITACHFLVIVFHSITPKHR